MAPALPARSKESQQRFSALPVFDAGRLLFWFFRQVTLTAIPGRGI
jgi:hypothetical protein